MKHIPTPELIAAVIVAASDNHQGTRRALDLLRTYANSTEEELARRLERYKTDNAFPSNIAARSAEVAESAKLIADLSAIDNALCNEKWKPEAK